MTAIGNVIVGVEMPESRPWDSANLDACSRIAVHKSFRFAHATGIPIKLVTVLADTATGFFTSEKSAQSIADSEAADAQAVLDDLLRDYADLQMNVTTQVAFGRPWLELLKAARGDRQTMIVCGTQQRNIVSQMLFGSTGLKLLRNAPGPVWLVQPRIDADAELQVLAATDLTPVGEDVLSTAISLDRAFPVKLTVLHVVDADLDRRMAHAGASDEEIADYRRQAKDTAEEELNEQLASTDHRILKQGIKTVVAEGVPEAAILSAITELDADLLVMATVGRGGIPGMLFGNTAERLISSVPCSLLAVKPDDFRCPVELD